MSADRAATANVLGAVALAVADQIRVTVAPAGGRSDSAAAALSALYHFPGRLTVDQLGRVLGLTHSGAVRLVDRLTGAGLVQRAPGADRRIDYLTSLLAGFSPAETDALRELLGRVMGQVVQHKQGGAWICRMCDLQACGRDAGDCPAANAAALKYGATRPREQRHGDP